MPGYNPEFIQGVIAEGMEDLGIREKARGKITIKPNVVMAHHKLAPSAFTRAEFLDGLIGAVREFSGGSAEVSLAEKSGVGLPTSRMFRRAVRLANDSDYGLTASVWTRNKKKASQIADKLQVGTVTVNDHMFSFVEPGALWGGVKQTGIGRSHGPFGLLELVNIKYISKDYSRKKTQLWWYPYHKDLAHLFKTATHIFHHDRFRNRLRALPALLPFLSHIQKGSPLGNYIKRIPRWLKK